LCIGFHIFPAVTTGFDVVQIEVRGTATPLTLRSAFCHHFFFDHSPLLVVFRIAEPDVVR
jgi:hypothetical protein